MFVVLCVQLPKITLAYFLVALNIRATFSYIAQAEITLRNCLFKPCFLVAIYVIVKNVLYCFSRCVEQPRSVASVTRTAVATEATRGHTFAVHPPLVYVGSFEA